MISLVIISNNISLNLFIAFIYHFIINNLFFQYNKYYLFIVRNCFFYITLLKNILVIILYIEKYIICYYILWGLAFILLFFLLPFIIII